MKTYTFKIKAKNADFPNTVVAINCPLEVFYDSVKSTPELVKQCSDFYVSQTDYIGDNGSPVHDDVFFGELYALVNSSDLREFLLNPDRVEVSENG